MATGPSPSGSAASIGVGTKVSARSPALSPMRRLRLGCDISSPPPPRGATGDDASRYWRRISDGPEAHGRGTRRRDGVDPAGGGGPPGRRATDGGRGGPCPCLV